MKKSIVLLLAILFTSIAWSQNNTVLSIENVNSDDLKLDDQITVHVYLECPLKDLSSFQLYLKYDQKVLDYQKITNVNPIIKDSWFDNHTPNFIAALYLDSKQMGIYIEGKQLLFDVEFIYKGGQTTIDWGTESKIEDGVMFMGETKFTRIEKTEVILNLKSACVCPSK